MKSTASFITGVVLTAVLLTVGIVSAQTQQHSSLQDFSPAQTAGASKACMFPDGGWTIVDCSNSAAASSAQLNRNSRYVVQCGDDSYIATGDTAASDDADSSDGWVPSGAWAEFMTDYSVRYLSCLNKNVDSDCRYIECR